MMLIKTVNWDPIIRVSTKTTANTALYEEMLKFFLSTSRQGQSQFTAYFHPYIGKVKQGDIKKGDGRVIIGKDLKQTIGWFMQLVQKRSTPKMLE